MNVAASNRRPRAFDRESAWDLRGRLTGGTREPSAQGSGHCGVRISLPSHDAFRAVHEERWIAADAVAQDPPEAEQRLGIQDANDDLIPMSPLHLPDPRGQAEILRLDVLGILVDLLRVDLLPDPRSIQERLAVGSVVESREDGS
jgi:hypothetical protein